MEISTVAGFKICAKRGGQPFLTAIRPNATSKCPEGTFVCNPDAVIDNQICSNKTEDCPINFMKLS
jgi:hypothetical protein